MARLIQSDVMIMCDGPGCIQRIDLPEGVSSDDVEFDGHWTLYDIFRPGGLLAADFCSLSCLIAYAENLLAKG